MRAPFTLQIGSRWVASGVGVGSNERATNLLDKPEWAVWSARTVNK
jgi:hypothetical protein